MASQAAAQTSGDTSQPAAAANPEAVVVRFAGDSGDGMQLTGGQFTLSTALAGNDLATFPDFPAETSDIRESDRTAGDREREPAPRGAAGAVDAAAGARSAVGG